MKEAEATEEVEVSHHRVFLLGENRWEEPSRLKGNKKESETKTTGTTTKCLTCRGEGRLLCTGMHFFFFFCEDRNGYHRNTWKTNWYAHINLPFIYAEAGYEVGYITLFFFSFSTHCCFMLAIVPHFSGFLSIKSWLQIDYPYYCQ